jgi:NAD(P)-dependent dehydrogenase (short-subunit alcohol dehydrogenase family)
MAKLLANKVVVITGSSQGIGRATAIGMHTVPCGYKKR